MSPNHRDAISPPPPGRFLPCPADCVGGTVFVCNDRDGSDVEEVCTACSGAGRVFVLGSDTERPSAVRDTQPAPPPDGCEQEVA